MITATDLKARENAMKEEYKIVDDGSVYAVTRVVKYFTDSYVSSGSWSAYTETLKTYKTLNAAKKFLTKKISCQFPAGYDISNIIDSVCNIAV